MPDRGTKSGRLAKKEQRQKASQQDAARGAAPRGLLPALRVAAVLVVYGAGYTLVSSGLLDSDVDQKMSIWIRLTFFIVAQSLSCELFAVLMLQVARLFTADDELSGFEPTAQEMETHDPSIPWPDPSLLSIELRPFASKPKQPFFLNHVPGRRRFKDAFMRFGMTLGSLLSVWFTSVYMDKRPLRALGLTYDRPFFCDMGYGFVVGVSIIVFTFAIELLAGWLHFLQFFEVFDKRESFSACILWDVVFHLNVAFNEELPMRGWMLYNIADALSSQFSISAFWAFLLGMVVESVFFVAMHLQSPGGHKVQSMLNLFVGGMAGGLNVLFTGGRLGFALGWHFGWNISMGNVFGLSTSGIPISATFISVAPHPEKQHLHGGVFGPEGGVVSPAAYTLGIVLLALIYGMPDGAFLSG